MLWIEGKRKYVIIVHLSVCLIRVYTFYGIKYQLNVTCICMLVAEGRKINIVNQLGHNTDTDWNSLLQQKYKFQNFTI